MSMSGWLRRGPVSLLLMFVAIAAIANEEFPPEARGVAGGMIVPVAQPRTGRAADADWIEIAALIKVIPPLNITPPYSSMAPGWRGYIYWQEFSNRLLRETGLRFCAEFPDDPRCWTWLQATLQRTPQYLDLTAGWQAQAAPGWVPVFDEAAKAAWAECYPLLRERCIAADSASEEFRVSLWAETLWEPIRQQGVARMAQRPYDYTTVDYGKIGESLRALGEKFPANESDEVRSAARRFLTYASRYAPSLAAHWSEVLARNPNPMLRELARSVGHLEAARTTPMAMRFTTVDGREVDLAKLRGKVVLIDFWAATWCGACKEQKPLLKETYAKYHAHGFEIIGIACEMKESDRAFLLDYVKKHEMAWPQYFDGKGMKNEYTVRYGFTGIPQYFLLNKDGLLAAHSSSSGGLRNLEAVVRKHLGLPPLVLGDDSKILGAP